MKIAYDLQKLSKELRDMPRHLWDEHLMGFCEALLMEQSGLERARIASKSTPLQPSPLVADDNVP